MRDAIRIAKPGIGAQDLLDLAKVTTLVAETAMEREVADLKDEIRDLYAQMDAEG